MLEQMVREQEDELAKTREENELEKVKCHSVHSQKKSYGLQNSDN